jgi:hypothetical protein
MQLSKAPRCWAPRARSGPAPCGDVTDKSEVSAKPRPPLCFCTQCEKPRRPARPASHPCVCVARLPILRGQESSMANNMAVGASASEHSDDQQCCLAQANGRKAQQTAGRHVAWQPVVRRLLCLPLCRAAAPRRGAGRGAVLSFPPARPHPKRPCPAIFGRRFPAIPLAEPLRLTQPLCFMVQERTAPTKRPNGERNFGGQGGTCHHCRRSSGNTRGSILTCLSCQCARRLKKPAYFHEGCLRLYYARQLVRDRTGLGDQAPVGVASGAAGPKSAKPPLDSWSPHLPYFSPLSLCLTR